MKHCLYIHQDYQAPKLSLYPLDEISCEYAHFPQVLLQSVIVKPCQMYFTCTFQLTAFVGQLMIFMAHALIYK